MLDKNGAIPWIVALIIIFNAGVFLIGTWVSSQSCVSVGPWFGGFAMGVFVALSVAFLMSALLIWHPEEREEMKK